MSIQLDFPAALVADPPSDNTPETEELYSSWALTILCILLILSLWTSYYVQIKRIRAVHETVLSIFAGMFVGLIVRLSPGHIIREMLTFKHTLFFNLLLPPIILNSGYELKQDNFFRNFASILTFAFFGTFISAVGLGVLVYLYSFISLESLNIGLLECLIFGSTLSATDPVTILAIFNQYKVDPKLYSVIFGESILNDAVSIVMYETLSQFHGEEIHVGSLFHGIGIFLLSFSTSMALGIIFGLSCSLMLKHSSLHHYPGIESCLVALIAYTSYFLSNGLHMSGIVSLLFCGITLKHYAYHTMSRRTQRTTKYTFAMLAQLSENFIFIYLGLNLFTQDVQVFKPVFILVTTISVCATRYAAVFPLSEIINFFHRVGGQRHEELPHSYQMMLFWAGLRGAVGVALAAGFKGPNAAALRTTVLVVVVLTVIIFGGTTARMLEVLGIKVGVEEDGASSDDEEGERVGAERLWLNGRAPRWSGRASLYGEQVPFMDGGRVSGGPGGRSLSRVFSAASEEDDEYSDSGEVLPMAPQSTLSPPTAPGPQAGRGGSGGSGTHSPQIPDEPHNEWSFTSFDERYLLPLFSNSVASRTFNARKASRRAALAADRSREALELGEGDIGYDSEDDRPGRGEARRALGPSLTTQFAGSVTDFFRNMRGGGAAASSSSLPTSPSEERRGLSERRPGSAGPNSGGDRGDHQ